MAKKTTVNKNSATDEEIETKAFGAAPKGGTKRTAERIRAWIVKQEGRSFVCKIIGRFSRPDQDTGVMKSFYQVRVLTDGVFASVKDEDELVPLKIGEMANLDENKGIEPLQAALADDEYYAWVHFIEKRPQDRDPRKTFWAIEVQSYKTCPDGVEDVEAPF